MKDISPGKVEYIKISQEKERSDQNKYNSPENVSAFHD
jgi:hypothetical protein